MSAPDAKVPGVASPALPQGNLDGASSTPDSTRPDRVCPMSCGQRHCPWLCPFELNAEAFPENTTVHADDLAVRDVITRVFEGTEVVRRPIGGAS
jgi:hypothetical protein